MAYCGGGRKVSSHHQQALPQLQISPMWPELIRNLVNGRLNIPGGVNDGNLILGSLELPQSNIDCDTAFPLCLELVEDPGILEGTLAELSSFLRVC